MKQSKVIFISLVISLTILPQYLFSFTKQSKIIGLVQVRNEENIIEQYLRALSCYTDAIVVLDDASSDDSLFIVCSLAEQLNIEKILTQKQSTRESGNESDNSQLLLKAGRQIGGTHFIVIDADEIFTANCMKNNYLRNQILSLQTGEKIEMVWIQLWRDIYHYRCDDSCWSWLYKSIIFCDDKHCSYEKNWLHASRIPQNLNGKTYRIPGYQYGFMHFQFVNWKNLLIKQAWYRCLERIREPDKSSLEINKRYAPSKDEKALKTLSAPKEWFEGYEFLDFSVFNKPVLWRKEQVLNWFIQYGKKYFKELDIWDINWEK
ncbi:MAG: glycosyltransferase family 2 protein [Candidatus Babeliales bacterium]